MCRRRGAINMFDYKQRSNLKDCIINDTTSHDWKDIFCKDKNGNIQDFFIDENNPTAENKYENLYNLDTGKWEKQTPASKSEIPVLYVSMFFGL